MSAILLCLTFLAAITRSQICFSPSIPLHPFPQILPIASYKCVAYELARIYAAGSPGMALSYDEATGGTLWSVQLNTSESFTRCSVGSLYFFAQSELGFSVFLKDTGILDSRYVYASPTKGLGIELNAANNLFVATSGGNQIQLSAFHYTAPSILTPLWSATLSDPAYQFSGDIMRLSPLGAPEAAIYVGGTLGAPWVTLFKFTQAANGANRWAVSIKDMAAVSTVQAWVKLDSQLSTSGSGVINHFGCAENIGTDTFDLSLLWAQENSAGSVTTGQFWFINASFKLRCLGVKAGQTQAQFVIHRESDYVFSGTVTYGFYPTSIIVNTLPLNQVSTSPLSVFARDAVFKSATSTSFFYVGTTKKVNSLVYAREAGFIHQFPTASCVTPTPATTSMPIYSRTFFQGVVTPLPPLYNSKVDIFTTTAPSSIQFSKSASQTVTSIGRPYPPVLPQECMALVTQGTIAFGTQVIPSAMSYMITQPMITLNFSNFTYSQACSDTRWSYTAHQANGSALPNNLMNFTETLTGGRFYIDSNDTSLAGFYTIQVTGKIGGLYTKNFSFDLNVTAPPPPTGNGTSTGNSSDNYTESTNSTTNTSLANTTTNSTNTTQGQTQNETDPTNTTTSNATITVNATTNSTSSSNTTANTSAAPSNLTATNTTSPPANGTTQMPITPVTNSQPPYFHEDLATSIQIQVHTLTAYTFPGRDPSALLVVPFASAKGMPKFITVEDGGKGGLKMKPGWVDIGRYYLIVRLEEAGMSSEYMMMIEVVKQKSIANAATNAEAPPNHDKNQTSQSSPVDRPGANYTSFTMRIGMISPLGEVNVIFSDQVLVPMGFKNFTQGTELALSVNHNTSLIASWSVDDFTSQTMTLQVKWADPFHISTLDNPDYLVIQVIDFRKFQSMSTSKNIAPNSTCSKLIPIQFKSSYEAKIIDALSSALAVSATVLTLGLLVLNLFLTLLLQQLWSMINNLQLILHVPLFTILLPPNVMSFFQALIKVVTMDFFDMSPKLQAIFSLPDESTYEAYNDRFDLLGYSTTNTIYNLGMPVFYLMWYVVSGALYGMLSCVRLCLDKNESSTVIVIRVKRANEWVLRKLRAALFWAPLMRFVVELALEGVISAILNLWASPGVTEWGYGQVISSLVSVFLITSNVALVPVFSYVMIKNRSDFEKLEDKFGEFIENQRTQFRSQMLYQSIFIIRRFLMIGIIFLLEGFIGLQLIAFQVLNLSYFSYLLSTKPVHDQYHCEVFNEACTLLLSTLLPCFTAFLPSADLQYRFVGYAFISVFSFNVVANLSLMCYETLRVAYIQVRWRYWKVRAWVRKQYLKSHQKEFSNVQNSQQDGSASKRRRRKRKNIKARKGPAAAAYLVDSPPDGRVQRESTSSPELRLGQPSPTTGQTARENINDQDGSRQQLRIAQILKREPASCVRKDDVKQPRFETLQESTEKGRNRASPREWRDFKSLFRTADQQSERKLILDTSRNISQYESPTHDLNNLILDSRKRMGEGFSLQLRNCNQPSIVLLNEVNRSQDTYLAEFNGDNQSQSVEASCRNLGQISTLKVGESEASPQIGPSLFKRTKYINATQKHLFDKCSLEPSPRLPHFQNSETQSNPQTNISHSANEQGETPQFKFNHHEHPKPMNQQSERSCGSFQELTREHHRSLMAQVPPHYFKKLLVTETSNRSALTDDLECGTSAQKISQSKGAEDALIFTTFAKPPANSRNNDS